MQSPQHRLLGNASREVSEALHLRTGQGRHGSSDPNDNLLQKQNAKQDSIITINMTTKIYIKKDTSFPITSVSRDDLIDAGFDASDVSDDIMTELASKMANAYVENTFWIDLGIIAEDLGVKKFNDN